MSGNRKVLLAVTSDMSLDLQRGFPGYLAAKGWEVHVVSNPGPTQDFHRSANPNITYHALKMARDPSPFKDLISLLQWIKLLVRIRPDIVSAGTPKAGLLGSVAGWVTRVPVRVYMLRGLRHEGLRGIKRSIMIALERVSVAAAHDVLAISLSVREKAIADRLGPSERFSVIGKGSSNGVDVDRFAVSVAARSSAREARWPNDSSQLVIGYVGRIHPDKGLSLLADAIEHLASDGQVGRLLIVGGSDGPCAEAIKARVLNSGYPVEFTGHVKNVESYYPLIDVLCLPTLREGFGNVVLEAAAAGIPTVATFATGIPDAIEEDRTGLICYSRNGREYADKISSLLTDPRRRAELAKAANRRVKRDFSNDTVWRNQYGYYKALLGNAGK